MSSMKHCFCLWIAILSCALAHAEFDPKSYRLLVENITVIEDQDGSKEFQFDLSNGTKWIFSQLHKHRFAPLEQIEIHDQISIKSDTEIETFSDAGYYGIYTHGIDRQIYAGKLIAGKENLPTIQEIKYDQRLGYRLWDLWVLSDGTNWASPDQFGGDTFTKKEWRVGDHVIISEAGPHCCRMINADYDIYWPGICKNRSQAFLIVVPGS